MIVHPVVQRSPEWYALTCGKLTSTDAADMMASPAKGKAVSARRRDLAHTLLVERLTQRSERVFQTPDMLRGIELEDAALQACEALLDRPIHHVGFVEHDSLPAGCSPDGVIGDFEGLVEVKCPKSATHLSYWKAGVLPPEYLYQVIHQLWITGAQWCQFVSFDDRFPAHLQLFHTVHLRDEVEMDSYELMARMFLSELDKEQETLWSLAPIPVSR